MWGTRICFSMCKKELIFGFLLCRERKQLCLMWEGMKSICVNRWVIAGSATTHASPVSTAASPLTRRAVLIVTCGCTWASLHSCAACAERSTHARTSWSTTSASTRETSPSTATSVARASPSRLSSTSISARTIQAARHMRAHIAPRLKPPPTITSTTQTPILPHHAALSMKMTMSPREPVQEPEEELHLLGRGYNRQSPPLGLIEGIGFDAMHGG